MKIKVEVKGIKQVIAKIKGLERDIKDASSPWQKYAAYLQNRIKRESFQGQKNFGGGAYKPLSRFTVEQKMLEGSKTPTVALVRTGKLRRGVTVTSSKTGVQIRCKQSYGVYHLYGGRSLPQRRFAPISVQDLDDKAWIRLRQLFKNHLLEGRVNATGR